MLRIRRLRLRLYSLFHRTAAERDLEREFEFHLAQQVAENVAAGMEPEEARRAALRAFGNAGVLQEQCRDTRRTWVVDNLVQDLRLGCRALRKSPGFAATSVLTIALGIGATTAIFSVVYGVLLKPLPYREPERLVSLWNRAEEYGLAKTVTAADHRDWRAQNHVFEDIALVRNIWNCNLTGEGEPERLLGARVSANLFAVLGVSPLYGRAFLDGEDAIGRDNVVILSHRLWRRRFAGDPSVAGRLIRLSGVPHIVAGVMDEGFRYPGSEFDLWKPLTINPEDFKLRLPHSFHALARLKSGVTVEQAQAEMDVIAARLARQYPANAGRGVLVAPMRDDMVAPVKTALWVLLGAVACVLLIGCGNLASLLLVRALGRARELTVRAALGASRWRLVQQAVTELLPVLVLGGALGLAAAALALEPLRPFAPASMPRVEEVAVNGPVLLFAACALALTGVLAAAWPAVRFARQDLAPSLKQDRRVTSSRRQLGLRNALVVAELAVTVTLLIGAGLLIRSFLGLRAVDPGFRTQGVLSVHIAIPRTKYTSDPAVARFCQRILERVQTLPEVERAGMINRLPLAGGVQMGPLDYKDKPGDRRPDLGDLDWRSVTPDYFRTMAIRLVRGRSFTEQDTEDHQAVVIVDDLLARLVWPGEDPIGKQVRIPFAGLPWCAVVGVVAHVRQGTLDRESRPQAYWSYLQRPMDRMALVARTRGEVLRAAASIAAEIRALDPEQPVYDVRAMEEVVDRSLAQRWLNAVLLALFAMGALLLATVGVYGLVSYSAGQRTREFGVRMALGATRTDVVGIVARQGLRLGALGVAAGVTCALVLTRVLETLLFGVGVRDWVSFSFGAAVLGAAALAASIIPARRAARVEPVDSLRCE